MIDLPYNYYVDFCVLSVNVNHDLSMIFNVSWTVKSIGDTYVYGTISKQSDRGNTNMYLTDNLGNHYNHINGGGAAYENATAVTGKPIYGWYLFESPPPGAFIFDFHDDDSWAVIHGITLSGSTLTFAQVSLTIYPLVIEYRKELWDALTMEDGSVLMQHKNLPACTLQEKPPAEPQGKYKNTLQIGKVTYEIYGYADPETGQPIREYLAVAGLEGLEGVKPFFYVTIPLNETSANCIMDSGDLLAKLSNPEP